MPGFWQRSVELWPYLGIFAEALGFALIPAVLVRRKEPPSTLAWILALIFLPGFGAVLFLVHGRDRMRWPRSRRKRGTNSWSCTCPRSCLASAETYRLGD